MTVLNIINEPTAAALAYGIDISEEDDHDPEKERIITVFDLGGGTFDVSILGLKDGLFDVKSTGGDTFLGGEDFDLAIVNFLIAEFRKRHGVDLTKDKMALQRIKAAGKKAKHDLSDQTKTEIELPFVSSAGGNTQDLRLVFERKTMETCVGHLLARLEEPCLRALEDAGLTAEDVDDVILVGGMTRMPLIKKQCQKIFGVTPIDTVNPDEAVAAGAAIQAGLTQGILEGLELSDVTPLSLGIETQGGTTAILIPRNTKVPASISEIFTTTSPNQSEITIHVLQGESDFAVDNKSLGRFTLENINPAPRGVPEIAITLEVDNSGIVNVSAKNIDTGQEQKIQIMASSGLSELELNRMMRDNRQHKVEQERRAKRDQERDAESQAISAQEGRRHESPEMIAARNALRASIFATQFLVDTQGRYIKKSKRKEFDQTLLEARGVLEESMEISELEAANEKVRGISSYLEEMLEAA